MSLHFDENLSPRLTARLLPLDFVAMAIQIGPTPRVIHPERCDLPLRVIEDLLRRNAIRISGFEDDPAGSLLTLRDVPGRKAR